MNTMNGLRTCLRRSAAALRRFLRQTRAGTGITAAAVTVMTVGGGALVVDHVWLYDQRDVLKTAAEAASMAATLEIDRQLSVNPGMSDADLENVLKPVAKRYLLLNLGHLPPQRFRQAKRSLDLVRLEFDRAERTVEVVAEADLGGTLFSRNLPLLGNYEGPEAVQAKAVVKNEKPPVEVVLAIDFSSSMGSPKIDIVREAAETLVDILNPSEYNRVAVGVVPWHSNVRLDRKTARRWERQGWASYPARRVYPEPYSCGFGVEDCSGWPVTDTLPLHPPERWRGCLDGERLYESETARPPTASSHQELFGTPRQRPFAQSFYTSTLAGWGASVYQCFTDARKPADFDSQTCYAEQPVSEAQPGCSGKQHTILALSTDRSAIDASLGSFVDRSLGSGTYSALGILWGQRLLDPAWRNVWGGAVHPADPDTSGFEDMRKAIVLLTDGQDTRCGLDKPVCENSPFGTSRTDACTRAKAEGTEIFVVGVGLSSETELTLRECSSEDDNPSGSYVFTGGPDRAQLQAAFASIANQLRTIRRVH